ncbi:hypothetical protein [Seonamhaeicola aphaedonensis]|uniref:Prophage protein DUF1660 n=1 Tax=Seonamhaeicola aphaedonensis TaxID=1461338 RepID=A0A3D9HM99_9FLAO|nr:hypothetical protein [Seonamhaeicola aphaedonensis]RED50451.1 hypothetical protein DFQ02_101483 [Seonamhaeicola aphaedonensis]
MKNIHCKMFGHDFNISRHITFYVKEYTCKNCKKEFTTNSTGTLTELTPKYREINAVLENIHKKRLRKRRKLNPDLLVFRH